MDKKDNESDVDDDFANHHPMDTNNSANSEDEETKDDTEDSAIGNFQGETFDISDTIDLDLEDLADVLSGKDSKVKKSPVKKNTALHGCFTEISFRRCLGHVVNMFYFFYIQFAFPPRQLFSVPHNAPIPPTGPLGLVIAGCGYPRCSLVKLGR